jgi:hypothetical protein
MEEDYVPRFLSTRRNSIRNAFDQLASNHRVIYLAGMGARGAKNMFRLQICVVAGGLWLTSALPAAPQQRDQHQQEKHDQYYNGMHQQVRKGDYDRYSREDEQRHHHDSGGGIGPGKAALIGGAGGAALGALFGGGLKGTLIGGAAGAGIGAIGGKLAEGNDHDHHH